MERQNHYHHFIVVRKARDVKCVFKNQGNVNVEYTERDAKYMVDQNYVHVVNIEGAVVSIKANKGHHGKKFIKHMVCSMFDAIVFAV